MKKTIARKTLNKRHSILMLTLVVAIGTATQSKAAGSTTVPCNFGAELAQVPSHTLSCLNVEVPATHKEPAGKQHILHVAFYKSNSPARKPDPVVVLNGGPGQRTGSIAPAAGYFVQALAPERDLLFFDQRGVGASQPRLDCDNLWPDRAASFGLSMEQQNQMLENYVTGCFAQLEKAQVNLGHFNTVESADDVGLIAKAVGAEKLNLYGVSYGSRLAQEVMRRHPNLLRSVVLDAVVTTDANYLQNRQGTIDAALRKALARCAADEACNKAYPNLQNRLETLAEKLEREPLKVQVPDMKTGKTVEIKVDAANLGGAIALFMYGTALVPSLPAFIDSVERGDTEFMQMILEFALYASEMNSIGMQFAFGCNDLIPFAKPEDMQFKGSLKAVEAMFQGNAEIYGRACQGFQWNPLDASTREIVKSDVPTLVLAGELDPVTPPQYAKQVLQGLTRARMVTFPDGAHGTFDVMPGSCVNTMVKAFLDDVNAELDTACAAQTRPFVIQ